MSHLTVSSAIPEDVLWLAERLRPADRAEVEAASGQHPATVLKEGLDRSDEAYSVLAAGRPIAMFGIVPVRPWCGVGAPWLLGTAGIETHWFQFARESRDWFARIGAGYRLLTNHVHAANTLHHRWLQWLGADFVELVRWGARGDEFWRFEFVQE